ncbi:MAG: prolyl oligopeptidase family serine peptidase [Candidatus Rokubacteria bacterium]|nr:prolyl oligopeptidase family serine peptidase [Candidatus Rokubacteria bacterium]
MGGQHGRRRPRAGGDLRRQLRRLREPRGHDLHAAAVRLRRRDRGHIHGARDVRVNVRESEQMVAALQQAGKEVRFVVFPDEGHSRSYGNWRNAIRHYTEVEDFLARCLGGRRTP